MMTHAIAASLATLWLVAGCSSIHRVDAHKPGSAPSAWVTPQQQWIFNPAFYAQAARGHWRLVQGARPIDTWLQDPMTPLAVQAQLRRVQQMRRFASDVLALPDNASYTRYVDLQRNAVVWNVVATPAYSVSLQQWCFPVAGCVGYKGFYNEAVAQAWAATLPVHWDVRIYPVTAYSTLGWSNWLGGDPVLNMWLGYDAHQLAGLLFHELAHQQLYVAGDMDFNESFATAVERLGVQRWLAHAKHEVPEDALVHNTHTRQQDQGRRDDLRKLIRRTRHDLMVVYAEAARAPVDATAQQKKAILEQFTQDYEALRHRWGGDRRFDAWVAEPNNALFAVEASYEQWVPAFKALFAQVGHDFAAFYQAAQNLAAQPAAVRQQRLQALLEGVDEVNVLLHGGRGRSALELVPSLPLGASDKVRQARLGDGDVAH